MADFNMLRQNILELPESERRQLLVWLQSLATSSSTEFDSGAILYAEIAHALKSYGYELERWERFAKFRPALAGSIRSRAIQLDTAIMRIFSGVSRTDHAAIRALLVGCAQSRCRDDNRELTLRTILESLYPLEELLDSQFPGQRASGIISDVVINHLHRTNMKGDQSETN